MSIDKKEVLAKADIIAIIGSRIPLKKEGNNYVARCPFHDEKSASFKVSPTKKIYKCFGCGISGDVLSFVEQFDRIDFPEAVKKVAETCGIIDLQEKEVEIIYDIPEERRSLLGPGWMNYMLQRGISPQTIEHLDITESVEYMTETKRKISV